MTNKILFIFHITAVLLLMPFTLQGQDYKYEIGGAAGIAFYMGDANKTTLFQNSQFAGGAVFRLNKNFRWSFKANLLAGKVSGDTRNHSNAFPFGQYSSFSRPFYELGAQVEFNFFNYSNSYQYLDTKTITPYVLLGVGMTVATKGDTFSGLNVPIGVGVKYKVRDRLNLGFEFSFRKLFGDSFDVTDKNGFNLDEPYKIKSSWIKNKDWYSLTMISLTWDFGPRCKPCLNIN